MVRPLPVMTLPLLESSVGCGPPLTTGVVHPTWQLNAAIRQKEAVFGKPDLDEKLVYLVKRSYFLRTVGNASIRSEATMWNPFRLQTMSPATP